MSFVLHRYRSSKRCQWSHEGGRAPKRAPSKTSLDHKWQPQTVRIFAAAAHDEQHLRDVVL